METDALAEQPQRPNESPDTPVAHAVGLIANRAAGLTKQRRARSRRGRSRRLALDDRDLAELIDAVRTTQQRPCSRCGTG
jgi:hypothetical protein